MTPARLIAVDTEDNSRGEVLLINFFDGESHYTFRERLPAWNWLRNAGPARIWACNMEYDINNIFGDWVDDLLTLTFNQSAFIKAQWSGHGLTFCDTLRHWPLSVESMGEKIGLPKLKASGAGNKFDDVEYCRRDTEIVFRFVEAQTREYERLGAEVKNTLPSSAFDLFKREFCKVRLSRPDDETCDRLMGAAYGGRVEIFKTGLLTGPIDCYDINSLYPSVMAANEYPLPASGRWGKFDPSSEGIISATVRVPDCYVPVLPFRLKKIPSEKGKLIFPVGEFSGVWTAPEIRAAIKAGAEIKRVDWAYNYTEKGRPFQEWVNLIYGRREKSSDELEKYTLKLFMNSVFGKFTEAGALQIYKKKKRTDLENRPDHANIVLGAYTTAYGRLRILEAIKANEKEICYTDTDSVFLKEAPPIKCGTGLGEWKLEGKYRLAEFVLPKFYLTVDADGKKRYKSKGVPFKARQEFFERGRAEYLAPMRFRESRRRLMPANVWEKKVRCLRANYEKRNILPNGETSPIKIG